MTSRAVGPSLVGILVAAGAIAAILLVLQGARPASPEVIRAPERGEVRPDYLADGTPVWVIGHDDGSVDVLAGFDTHTPFGLNKVLWWCETADAFENPDHGSKYESWGVKLGGPAPRGLFRYDVSIQGGEVVLGELREGPPAGTIPNGPPEQDRDWCLGLDDDVVWHTFEDLPTWDSPADAVAAEPEGWIVLEGQLVVTDDEVRLCGVGGCRDAIRADNVEVPPPDMEEFGPLGGARFIAQVRDGVLVGVTRVLPANPPSP